MAQALLYLVVLLVLVLVVMASFASFSVFLEARMNWLKYKAQEAELVERLARRKS